MLEAVHDEVDRPGRLQEYGRLNMKKLIDAEGLEKGVIDAKNYEKSTICF